MHHMILRMNKMLPNFDKSLSNCPFFNRDVHAICDITCTKKKSKVRTNMSNQGKCIKGESTLNSIKKTYEMIYR